jgi:GntR family transcriptional regulator
LFIALSNNDPTPLYEQIKKQIIEQIMSGELPPGYMLPSIRALAKELEISVITVKKAYEDLEANGYIVTNQGKGSFVAQAGAEFVRESKLKEIQKSFERGIALCRELSFDDGGILKVFCDILDEFGQT